MISNAEIGKDGRLTDKGNMKINAARMITKTLHDYDEGMILGIGAYMQVSGNQKTGESKTSFDKMSLSVDYRNCASNTNSHLKQYCNLPRAHILNMLCSCINCLVLKRNWYDVQSALGIGQINIGSSQGDTLAKDINQTRTVLRSEKGKMDSVIYGDMMRDINKMFTPKTLEEKAAKLEQDKQEKEQLVKNIKENLFEKLANDIDNGTTRIIPSFLLQYFGGIAATTVKAGKDFQEKLEFVGNSVSSTVKGAYEFVSIKIGGQSEEEEVIAWQNKRVKNMQQLEQELESRAHLLLEQVITPSAGETDEQGPNPATQKIEFARLQVFLKNLETESENDPENKAAIKLLLTTYRKNIEVEIAAAKKENRAVKQLAQLLSEINANHIYKNNPTSFIAKVEPALIKALATTSSLFAKIDAQIAKLGQNNEPEQQNTKNIVTTSLGKAVSGIGTVVNEVFGVSEAEAAVPVIPITLGAYEALLACGVMGVGIGATQMQNNEEVPLPAFSGISEGIGNFFRKGGEMDAQYLSDTDQIIDYLGAERTNAIMQRPGSKPHIDKPQTSPFFDLDPNHGKPSILFTPWSQRPPGTLSYPDQSDLLGLFKNPGFETPKYDFNLGGFDLHKPLWENSGYLGYNILEKSKHKDQNKNKSKTTANSENQNDLGDYEEHKDQQGENGKQRNKKGNYEKNDFIGIERFTKREKGGGLTDPKSGQYLSPERGNQPHGGSYWKLKSKKGAKNRIGTISQDGRFLRE
jgi:hypothetical protein